MFKQTLKNIVDGTFKGSSREKQRLLYRAYRTLTRGPYPQHVMDFGIYEEEQLMDLGLVLAFGRDRLARRKPGTMLTARAEYENGPGDPVFADADTGQVMSFSEFYRSL